MKSYYHISKSKLSPGTVVNSYYGKNITDQRVFQYNDHYYSQYLKEIIFEDFRSSNFPNAPSRLSSIYLIDDLRFIGLLQKRISGNFIYEVEISDTAILLQADMNWMDLSNRQALPVLFQYASNYFSGIPSENILWEVLCDGEVKVIDELKII